MLPPTFPELIGRVDALGGAGKQRDAGVPRKPKRNTGAREILAEEMSKLTSEGDSKEALQSD